MTILIVFSSFLIEETISFKRENNVIINNYYRVLKRRIIDKNQEIFLISKVSWYITFSGGFYAYARWYAIINYCFDCFSFIWW
jgi:hypothetical protein